MKSKIIVLLVVSFTQFSYAQNSYTKKAGIAIESIQKKAYLKCLVYVSKRWCDYLKPAETTISTDLVNEDKEIEASKSPENKNQIKQQFKATVVIEKENQKCELTDENINHFKSKIDKLLPSKLRDKAAFMLMKKNKVTNEETVIIHQNGYKEKEVASTQKLISSFTFYKLLQDHHHLNRVTLDKDDKYADKFGGRGAQLTKYTGSKNHPQIRIGEEVSIKDVINSSLHRSSNSATVLFSKFLNISRKDFMLEMNTVVDDILGHNHNTCFQNETGLQAHITYFGVKTRLLPDFCEGKQQSTLYDMNRLTSYIAEDDGFRTFLKEHNVVNKSKKKLSKIGQTTTAGQGIVINMNSTSKAKVFCKDISFSLSYFSPSYKFPQIDGFRHKMNSITSYIMKFYAGHFRRR